MNDWPRAGWLTKHIPFNHENYELTPIALPEARVDTRPEYQIIGSALLDIGPALIVRHRDGATFTAIKKDTNS